MMIFAMVAVIGTILAGGIWHFGVGPATAQVDTAKESSNRIIVIRQNDFFVVRGVKIGMTVGDVRKLFPRMVTKGRRAKESTGHFVSEGVSHTVWFAPGTKPGAVYRIRYREPFSKLSADDIMARFGASFGQPAFVDCRQGSRISRQGLCHMKWLTRDGVNLEVRSQNLISASGRSVTVLTVTATDAATVNKLAALRSSGRA
ncbi:MAG: hypothetical protein ISR47_09105 [Rhodospirillales bacterium]|nr:hypothetical protein [Rhodospirillales bacterium]